MQVTSTGWQDHGK